MRAIRLALFAAALLAPFAAYLYNGLRYVDRGYLMYELLRGARDLPTFGIVCVYPFLLVAFYVMVRTIKRDNWEAWVETLPLSKQIELFKKDAERNPGGLFGAPRRLW